MKREEINNFHKAVFIAQDPGEFNVVTSIIKKIKNSNIYSILLVDGVSINLSSKNKLKYINCTNLKENKLKSILLDIAPDILVCGFSDGLSLDKKMIKICKELKIPTLSIADSWLSDYTKNYSSPGTRDKKYLPNIICAIDRMMKKQMVNEEIPKNIIRITGNPYFESFSKHYGKEKYIVFVCQPYSEIQKEFGASLNELIIDEVQIFKDFVQMIEKYFPGEKLIVAFHPRAKKRDKFNKIIDAGRKIKIKIINKDTEKIIKDAKIVIGIDSIVLFQSAMMGKTTISYQPNGNTMKDHLMSNHLKLSIPAYSFNQLEKIFKNLQQYQKNDSYKKIRNKFIMNKSSEKIVSIMNKLIN
jgi:hypothetical protein